MTEFKPYRRKGRDGLYVDFGNVKLPDGTRKRFRSRKCEGTNLTQAKEWARKEYVRLVTHGLARRKEEIPTVDEVFERYLKTSTTVGGRRGRPLGDRFVADSRSAYKVWIQARLGTLKVTDLDRRCIDNIVADMRAKGLKPRTIRNVLDVLSGCLKHAKDYGDIERVSSFPSVEVNRTDSTAYTWEQMEHALDVARNWNDPDSYPLLLLGFHAGMYQEEIKESLTIDVSE